VKNKNRKRKEEKEEEEEKSRKKVRKVEEARRGSNRIPNAHTHTHHDSPLFIITVKS
jgi:hypothetical protein